MGSQLNNHWWESPPPTCQAMVPIDPINGQHNVNEVWQGDVLLLDSAAQGEVRKCVFKYHLMPGKLPVEMACTLVGGVLGNDVPQPCLVLATPADLPGLPAHAGGSDDLLLFGCTHVDQDRFFEHLATLDNHTLGSAVWNSFCSNAPKAAKAAALDELITNFDRHPRNLRFDGSTWWLIDHDQSLLETHGKVVGEMDANFKSLQNQIADELLDRRRQDHQMADAARLSADKQQQVLALAARIRTQWRNADPRISEVWHHTADLVELLSRRLPMLQSLVGERIGALNPPSLTWTPTPQQPPSNT